MFVCKMAVTHNTPLIQTRQEWQAKPCLHRVIAIRLNKMDFAQVNVQITSKVTMEEIGHA